MKQKINNGVQTSKESKNENNKHKTYYHKNRKARLQKEREIQANLIKKFKDNSTEYSVMSRSEMNQKYYIKHRGNSKGKNKRNWKDQNINNQVSQKVKIAQKINKKYKVITKKTTN